MPYDCFISYASSDFEYANELDRCLKEKGIDVWLDKSRLRPGFDWYREIRQHCENSRVVLPVLTPRWKQSNWTKFETYGAEAVIPLLFEGEWMEVSTPPLEQFQFESVDLARGNCDWERLAGAIRRRKTLLQAPRRIKRVTDLPPKHFAGRIAELNHIHEAFHSSPTADLTQGRILAITGLGGAGQDHLGPALPGKVLALLSVHVLG